MANYEEKDDASREEFIRSLWMYKHIQYQKYRNKYEPVDIDVTATTQSNEDRVFTAELKWRTGYTSYSFATADFELDKLNEMLEHQDKYSTYGRRKYYYVMLWADFCVWVFDINQVKKLLDNGQLKVEKKLRRKNNFTDEKVFKDIIELPKTIAKTYEYK